MKDRDFNMSKSKIDIDIPLKIQGFLQKSSLYKERHLVKCVSLFASVALGRTGVLLSAALRTPAQDSPPPCPSFT